MKKNRFYTLMLIPEKTSHVKKWLIPGWLLHGGLFISVMIVFLLGIMLIDYGFVMNQINEVKDLKQKKPCSHTRSSNLQKQNGFY